MSMKENAFASLNRSTKGLGVANSELVINVSDYTGGTDAERIQRALNDVPPEGAIVFVPAGSWSACNLTAKSGTTLMGENGTVFERQPNTALPFVTFENATDFAVTRLAFDGQNVTDGTGLYMLNTYNFSITDCFFKDVAHTAVYIIGAAEHFVVENNVFINSNDAPILIFGSPGIREISNFTVANNTLIDCPDNGKIGVAFAADGVVADNYVARCNYGVATRCDSNIVITRNHIENCSNYGIYLGTQIADPGSFSIDIADNYVVGCGAGIERYYGDGDIVNVTVENNTMLGNSQFDVYADFSAAFLNNTFTSRENVELCVLPTRFVGNVNARGQPMIPADVDGNGLVDMQDIGLVCSHYGVTQGSENWDPRLDVVQDGVIDMLDVGFCAGCFLFAS